jgi:hypothetical protein
MDENLKNRTVELLEGDQNILDGVEDKQSEYEAPKTMDKVTVTENPDGTWDENKTTVDTNIKDEGVIGEKEKEIEDDAKTLQQFCGEVDSRLLGITSQIDDKKRQIVTLSLNAGTHMNCTSSQVGGGFTCINMKEEVEWINIYDKMAGPDVDFGTENPFDPDSTKALTEVLVGYGYSNVAESMVRENSSGVTGLKTDGSGSGINTLGRFDINGSGSPASGSQTCAQIASSITTLYNEIMTLRGDMDTLRGNLIIVKTKKADKELENWGCKSLESEITARKTSETTVITAVNDLYTP